MKLERDAWWLVALGLFGVSVLIAWAAEAQTLGRSMPVIAVAILVLAGCFRLFEHLLHMRFPTKQAHTSSGRYACYALVVVLVAQALMVMLGTSLTSSGGA
jgi:uncharacterized membrane protein